MSRLAGNTWRRHIEIEATGSGRGELLHVANKNEGVLKMNINLERLIGAVQEQFEREQNYAMACKKPYYKWTPEEKETYIRCDRERYTGNNGISDICTILNLNWKKLDTIARLARKWEQKHDWQKCFPVQEHEKQIMQYIIKSDPFAGSNIEYIHYKINKKAEKKAA
jgi:hypothetical protein